MGAKNLFNFIILALIQADALAQQSISLQPIDSSCNSNDNSIHSPPEVFSGEGVCSDGLEDKEDPMLRLFPTPFDPNFKAYVRADISSFYNELPESRVEQKPAFDGQAGKFVNISPYRLALYWDDGQNGRYVGNVGPWNAGGTATFPYHKFFFANERNASEIVCRFVALPGISVYYFDPFTTTIDDEMVNLQPGARAMYGTENSLSLSTLTEEEKEMYDAHRFNLKFGVHYKNFTGGQEWLSMYPRLPPKHKVWRADYFGQEHSVQTRETHFMDVPPKESWGSKEWAVPRNKTDPVSFEEYRAPGNMNITIKALSCAPRVFEIRNFLSDVEVDHMHDLIKSKQLKRSTVGDRSSAGTESGVRTSRNTWLPRDASPVLDAIYRRAADALRLDEALLRNRRNDEVIEGYEDIKGQINEPLQVVHYDQGQEYTPHHDMGFIDGKPDKACRSINLCMYLNEGMEGGETAFPRWRNAETSDSIKVVPEKGKAVIFYMVNPDGNLDDLSQHGGLPVINGEKWFSNLWIWDPQRP